MRQHRSCAVLVGIVWTFVLLGTLAPNAEAFVRDWLRTRDEVGPCNDHVEDVQTNENGEAFVVKGTCGLISNYVLIKYDIHGDILWRRPLGNVRYSTANVRIGLFPLPLGGIVVVRNLERANSPTDSISITEFGADGIVVWNERHFISDDFTKINDAKRSPDGRIALALAEDTFSDEDGRAVAVFDEFGHLLWNHIPDEANLQEQEGLALAWGEDGSLYVLSESNRSSDGGRVLEVLKFDEFGNVVWSAPPWEPMDDVQNLDDASMTSVGDRVFLWMTIRSRTLDIDEFPSLIAFDLDGYRLWQQAFWYEDIDGYGAAHDLQTTGDGFAFLTYQMELVTGVTSGVHLMKIDLIDGNPAWDVAIHDDTGLDYDDSRTFRLAHGATDDRVWLVGSSETPLVNDSNIRRMTYLAYDEFGTREVFTRFPDSAEMQREGSTAAAVLPSGSLVTVGSRGFDIATDGEVRYDRRYNTLVTQVDAAGAGQWVRELSVPRIGTSVYVQNALASPTGGVDIAATIETDDGNFDMTVTHRDAAGVVRWLARYGGPESGEELMSRVERDPQGNLYALGTAYRDDGLFLAIAKFDLDGGLLWARELEVGRDEPYKIETITSAIGPEGDLYAAGVFNAERTSTYTGTWMIRISPDGDVVWVNPSIRNDETHEAVRKFLFDNDGSLVVLSESLGAGDEPDVAVLRKLSLDGDVLWETTHASAFGSSILLNGPFPIGDEWLVSGTVRDSLAGVNFVPIAVRFDADGNLIQERIVDFTPWLGTDTFPYDLADMGAIQTPSGNVLWVGTYMMTPWADPRFGAFLARLDEAGEPTSFLRFPGIRDWGSTPAHGGQVVGVDSLERIYWPLSIGDKRYFAVIAPGDLVYALVSFESPWSIGTDFRDLVVANDDEFYAVGGSTSLIADSFRQITAARYVNPCGTTSCPWLGSCVDVGDVLPGNSCMVCEMEGGFAQFLPIANGTVCGDDGRFCNGETECNEGLCLPAGNPCVYPQLCMERGDECVDPIPIGAAMPEDAVPTSPHPEKPEAPDVNVVMLRAWVDAARAEADGEAFDPAMDDTDWSLLDTDDALGAPTAANAAAPAKGAGEDEEAGGCGQ